jgi:CRP-like cAMP-binding protein
MTQDIDFLAEIPLFSRLDREALQGLVGHMRRHAFSAGEEIIKEGETDRRLFIIAQGEVDVMIGRGQRGERLLKTLGPREFFGEMALIDDSVRSASVVARADTVALVLDQWDLHAEIRQSPAIAGELLKTLSHRIRALQRIVMHTLGGLLPICLNCKSIRDENGVWVRIEDYIGDRSDADFTHGICPGCLKRLCAKRPAEDLD